MIVIPRHCVHHRLRVQRQYIRIRMSKDCSHTFHRFFIRHQIRCVVLSRSAMWWETLCSVFSWFSSMSWMDGKCKMLSINEHTSRWWVRPKGETDGFSENIWLPLMRDALPFVSAPYPWPWRVGWYWARNCTRFRNDTLLHIFSRSSRTFIIGIQHQMIALNANHTTFCLRHYCQISNRIGIKDNGNGIGIGTQRREQEQIVMIEWLHRDWMQPITPSIDRNTAVLHLKRNQFHDDTAIVLLVRKATLCGSWPFPQYPSAPQMCFATVRAHCISSLDNKATTAPPALR